VNSSNSDDVSTAAALRALAAPVLSFSFGSSTFTAQESLRTISCASGGFHRHVPTAGDVLREAGLYYLALQLPSSATPATAWTDVVVHSGGSYLQASRPVYSNDGALLGVVVFAVAIPSLFGVNAIPVARLRSSECHTSAAPLSSPCHQPALASEVPMTLTPYAVVRGVSTRLCVCCFSAAMWPPVPFSAHLLVSLTRECTLARVLSPHSSKVVLRATVAHQLSCVVLLEAAFSLRHLEAVGYPYT
jgi:hypothetical protein